MSNSIYTRVHPAQCSPESEEQPCACLGCRGGRGRSPCAGVWSCPDVRLSMGCRLCGLQKPEEQYRLLYEVCQVTVAFYSGQRPGKEREVSVRVCVLSVAAWLFCMFSVRSYTSHLSALGCLCLNVEADVKSHVPKLLYTWCFRGVGVTTPSVHCVLCAVMLLPPVSRSS